MGYLSNPAVLEINFLPKSRQRGILNYQKNFFYHREGGIQVILEEFYQWGAPSNQDICNRNLA